MAKSIQQWLDEYGESHQNKTNKMIHWFCVPQIFLTVMAFVYAIPTPAAFAEISPYLNWASIVSVLVVGYYAILSLPLSLGMAAFTALCFYIVYAFNAAFPGFLLPVAGGYFVLLWIGQFYGHEVEGKKPSFFKDLQFLMIGPAWCMSFLYGKVGLKY